MADQANQGDRGGKVGSSPDAARKVGGKGDFGIPESDVPGRQYTSENTKQSDPGSAHPHAGTEGGDRTAGVGGDDVGDGSNSAGDIDTSIVGVGTGGSGVGEPTGRGPGPDDSDGSSNEFASGPPSKSKPDKSAVGKVGGNKRVRGSTVTPSDDLNSGSGGGFGPDDATNPARHDDSFAGEVSSDEAGGEGG